MKTAVSLSLILAAVALTACGQKQEAAAPAAAESAPVPAAPTDAEQAKLLASLPAPYNTGDLVAGKRQFAKCRSCHTLQEGAADLTGPNLYGVFGRKAGSKEGYHYSDAVKAAGFTWDAEHLDKWLANPREFMPGTKMSFLGVKDEKDRVDLIAYLKTQTGYKPE
jgi:cytochrome c